MTKQLERKSYIVEHSDNVGFCSMTSCDYFKNYWKLLKDLSELRHEIDMLKKQLEVKNNE